MFATKNWICKCIWFFFPPHKYIILCGVLNSLEFNLLFAESKAHVSLKSKFHDQAFSSSNCWEKLICDFSISSSQKIFRKPLDFCSDIALNWTFGNGLILKNSNQANIWRFATLYIISEDSLVNTSWWNVKIFQEIISYKGKDVDLY